MPVSLMFHAARIESLIGSICEKAAAGHRSTANHIVPAGLAMLIEQETSRELGWTTRDRIEHAYSG